MKGFNFLPEYSHMSESRYNRGFKECSDTILPPSKDDNQLQSVIFAPNPLTGVPQSDLGYIMSQDSNPAVAEYIKQNLLREVIPASSSVDDADVALDFTYKNGESIVSYASRLRDSVRKAFESEQSEKSKSE